MEAAQRVERWLERAWRTVGDGWQVDSRLRADALELADLHPDAETRKALDRLRCWSHFHELVRDNVGLKLPPRSGLASLSGVSGITGPPRVEWLVAVIRRLAATFDDPDRGLLVAVLDGREAAEAAISGVRYDEREQRRLDSWRVTRQEMGDATATTEFGAFLLAMIAHLVDDRAAVRANLDLAIELAAPGSALQIDAYRRLAGLRTRDADPEESKLDTAARIRDDAAEVLERGYLDILNRTGEPAVALLSDLDGLAAARVRYDAFPSSLLGATAKNSDWFRAEAEAGFAHAQTIRRLWLEARPATAAEATTRATVKPVRWTLETTEGLTRLGVITTRTAVAQTAGASHEWPTILAEGLDYLARFPGTPDAGSVGLIVTLAYLECGQATAAWDHLVEHTRATWSTNHARWDRATADLIQHTVAELPSLRFDDVATLLDHDLGPQSRAATTVAAAATGGADLAASLVQREVDRLVNARRATPVRAGSGTKDDIAKALDVLVSGLGDLAYRGATPSGWTPHIDAAIDADLANEAPLLSTLLWRRTNWSIERGDFETATADALRYARAASDDTGRYNAQRLLALVADAREKAGDREAVRAIANLALEHSTWLDSTRSTHASQGLTQRARALDDLGQRRQAIETLKVALGQGTDDVSPALATWVTRSRAAGHADGASWLAELTELRAAVDAGKRPDSYILLTWHRAYALKAAEDLDAALAEVESLFDLADQKATTSAKRADVVRLAASAIEWCEAAGWEPRARAIAEKLLAVRGEREFNDLHEGRVAVMESRALLTLGRDAEARERLRAIVWPEGRRPFDGEMRTRQRERSDTQLDQGWTVDAVDGWREMAAVSDADVRRELVREITRQVESFAGRGRSTEAIELVAELLDLTDDPEQVAVSHSYLGELLAEEGQLDRAMDHLDIAAAESLKIVDGGTRVRVSAETAFRLFRVTADSVWLRRLMATVAEGLDQGVVLPPGVVATVHGVATLLGLPEVDVTRDDPGPPPRVASAEDLRRDDVIQYLLSETMHGSATLRLAGPRRVDLARSRRLHRWVGELIAVEPPVDAAPVILAISGQARVAWTTSLFQVNAARNARPLGRALLTVRAVPTIVRALLARADVADSLDRRFDAIWSPPDRVLLRAIDEFEAAAALADRLPVSLARLLYRDLGAIWDSLVSLVRDDRRREDRGRRALRRLIPHALRLDARAATSVDLGLRDQLLASAAEVWGATVAFSDVLGDDRLTAEILAVRRASLVLGSSPAVTAPAASTPSPEDARIEELRLFTPGDERDREAAPDEVVDAGLAIAASGVVLSAFDRRGIPVRPRPLVRMPDGRIALAEYLDALTEEQRYAWTTRVVVPLA